MKIGIKELLLIFIVSILLFFTGWYTGFHKIIGTNISSTQIKASNILGLLHEHYYPIFDLEQSNKSLNGLLSELGDGTYYLSPDQYLDITNSHHKKSALQLVPVDNNTYVIKFDWFSENMQNELEEIVGAINNTKDTRVVIDFRSNLGGNLKSSISFLNLFVADKRVGIEKTIDSESDLTTNKNTPLSDVNLIVIVSKETSSSAELVTAALQETKRAKVVGSKTYGKTTTGNYFEFADGSAVHITTGEWLTSEGKSLKEGVTPDVKYNFDSDEDLFEYLTTHSPDR